MELKNIQELCVIHSKKMNNIIISILSCSLFIFMLFNIVNKISRINEEEKKNASNIFLNINRKTQFIMSTLNDLKFDDKFNEYISKNENDQEYQYLKSALHRKIISGNNIYGSIGYLINFSTNNLNYYMTSTGIVDKKTFYKNNKFPYESIEKKIKSVSDDGNYINIFINDKGYLGLNKSFWVIKLDKNSFFYEIEDKKDWYLRIDNTISLSESENKNSEIIKNINHTEKKNSAFKENLKLKGRNLHVFYLSEIDAELYYYQPRINLIMIIAIEIIKSLLFFGLLYFTVAAVINLIIKPIKELAEKIGYGNEKGTAEIDYIETKIEELSTTNVELTGKIKELSEIQKRKKLKDSLLGIPNEQNVEKILWEKEYRVILMEIDDVDSVKNIYDNFRLSKEFVMKYFLNEVAFEVIDIDFKSIVIVIENFPKEEMEPILDNLIFHIERNFSLYFVAAVTDKYNDLKDLPLAYRTAKRIMDYKYIYKQYKVIFQNIMNENQLNKYYYPIQLEAKLITKTLSSNTSEVKKIIQEIFGNDIEQKLINKKAVKEFNGLLYNTLNQISIQLDEMNIGEINRSENFEKFLKITEIKELKEVFSERLIEICKFIKENSEIDIRTIKNSIEKYMTENYMKDISLENLSEYLGYSFKYTSILFKKIMGDNFKNYLSLYRIKKAKELMEEKEYKIKELAELVGYNSSNTFIRMFRKYEGVSPGKYFFDTENEV
ncbi:helix-turn-helix domain-containing protein [Pseudoleptotrichia goodfellowii]|uniref:Transcriptional regulator, AraC family n=2 Tax=Pseudoleptotrichia goodfellowii TaxID=157692 RepID=D0GMR1_9FUSO|nr:helix-turn-helix domain-containing protein [Pseudoleptotrichia goodfellowii]EEY34618.1 transcriptional regulator, AraC family [Pseudoleptotrichia goodfellowii F0264]MBF4805508.1 helix-turn-helix domain-containing protein [Pseudoleptotrichia goodfellowii]BBM36584.1 transcriptional regulator, AraC family [Pseudoleptotrichia goodfellowii]